MSANQKFVAGWDYMLSAIINSLKNKSFSSIAGCDELEAVQKIVHIPEIRYFGVTFK